MTQFYFTESIKIPNEIGNEDYVLLFKQSGNDVEFEGALYSPVEINKSNIIQYTSKRIWDQFINNINKLNHIREELYTRASMLNSSVGTIDYPYNFEGKYNG